MKHTWDLLKTNDSTELKPVVAPSEEVKLDIKCPFCGEDGFDRIGLKNHLENPCKEYETTERI